MVVIADTGPLIALAKAGRLDILHAMADTVLIPEAVHHELLAKPGEETGRIRAALSDFIHVRPVLHPEPTIAQTPTQLGRGESQVLQLASSQPEDVMLLLDDRAARMAAQQLGLRYTGVVGLVLEAKKRDLLSAVVPTLRDMRQAGYWLSDELLAMARELAGE